MAVSKQSGSDSFGMGKDGDLGKIDPETYVSVQLKSNGTVVQVKGKRIQMRQKLTSRSRSRSASPKQQRQPDETRSHH